MSFKYNENGVDALRERVVKGLEGKRKEIVNLIETLRQAAPAELKSDLGRELERLQTVADSMDETIIAIDKILGEFSA